MSTAPVPTAPDPAGLLIRSLTSPAFTVSPPRISNRSFIPPEVLAACEASWQHGTFAERPVTFRLFENVIVAKEGLVFTDALELVPASRTQHDDADISRALAAIAEMRLGGTTPEVAGSCVLCKKRGAGNYGHWLMEMLPKAVLARENLPLADLRFIVPQAAGRLAAAIDDSLRRAGIPPSACVPLDDAPVRVQRLVLIDGLTTHGSYMSPLAVAAVRRLARDIMPGPDRALYVSRASTGHRLFRDEGAVMAQAHAAGFVPFDPTFAEFAEQIAAFAGAGRIAGVMGAALTNIVFAPQGAEVVVFAPANMPDTFFWFIAGLCGLNYHEVRCAVDGPVAGTTEWDRALLFPADLATTLFPPWPGVVPPRLSLPVAAARKEPPTRLFRRVSLDEIVSAGIADDGVLPRAERLPLAPAAILDVPPFAFGDTDLRAAPIAESARAEAMGRRLVQAGLDAWRLRDVLVHGSYGILTLDDRVVNETLAHAPLHIMPGAGMVGAGGLRLPERPLAATLPAAYHLLAGNLQSYFHWLVDALSRFNLTSFDAMGSVPAAPGGPVLLVPHLDVFWKWETLHLLVPDRIPRIAVTPEGRLAVQRLLFVPDLSGAGFLPHPRLLEAFDAIATVVLGSASVHTARPWRRLYIARSDSRHRVLANEAEIAACAEGFGFTRVVLSEMPVPEQVRLFAEASHILAPHGAGLANIGFCRPGAKLCELNMDTYLNWAFRRLAALRGLRYGCLIGETIGPRQDWPHANTWRIDPAAVAAVLRDPRFLGD